MPPLLLSVWPSPHPLLHCFHKPLAAICTILALGPSVKTTRNEPPPLPSSAVCNQRFLRGGRCCCARPCRRKICFIEQWVKLGLGLPGKTLLWKRNKEGITEFNWWKFVSLQTQFFATPLPSYYLCVPLLAAFFRSLTTERSLLLLPTYSSACSLYPLKRQSHGVEVCSEGL